MQRSPRRFIARIVPDSAGSTRPTTGGDSLRHPRSISSRHIGPCRALERSSRHRSGRLGRQIAVGGMRAVVFRRIVSRRCRSFIVPFRHAVRRRRCTCCGNAVQLTTTGFSLPRTRRGPRHKFEREIRARSAGRVSVIRFRATHRPNQKTHAGSREGWPRQQPSLP